MKGPAGQGGSCESTSGADADDSAPSYCTVCGRSADAGIRRGPDVFCSQAHADVFARDVAAIQATGRREE